MKRLFNITVNDCDEIERLTKFYEDLGYQVERGSNYIGSWEINIGIKEIGEYAI